MLECPFTAISCSWPRPVQADGQHWLSDPEWDAPLMPSCPRPHLELLNDAWYWTLNYRAFFRGDLRTEEALKGGEMRGFHIICTIKIHATGILHFVSDDGCIIRYQGQCIYSQRAVQQRIQHKIEVTAGTTLEIALHHTAGEWRWSAYLLAIDRADFTAPPDPVKLLLPYLEQVQHRLQQPNGPPLKVYTSAREPIRAVLAIYSLILNGDYAPSAIYLFGSHQWRPARRMLMQQLLPFARIVPVRQITAHLKELAGPELASLAIEHWYVMKVSIALFYPPYEFCLLDDDVIILDRLDDALEAFKTHNLVYTTNYDYSEKYEKIWGHVYKDVSFPLPTGTFNAGLYWLRNTRDPRHLVAEALQVPPASTNALLWEQGFFSTTFARESSLALSSQRYYAPAIDGMPGGLLGYDYAHNPCKFASIHLMGVTALEKPSNGEILTILPYVLKAAGTPYVNHD